MLPGVGVFGGSDAISDVLVHMLLHFDFQVHAIWSSHPSSSLKFTDTAATGRQQSQQQQRGIVTTSSIDSVLLNKNVHLIFVCCQPNLHAQIANKALGIGKNVCCVVPTSRNADELAAMINSARYYPSLVASTSYGGLCYLPEFRALKRHVTCGAIGRVKLCNIVVNCRHITTNCNSSSASPNSASAASAAANVSFDWLTDRDLGAGVLNRYGASLISLVLDLFDARRCTKVCGQLSTFIDEHRVVEVVEAATEDASGDRGGRRQRRTTTTTTTTPAAATTAVMRRITADDHCTFQMNMEPDSVLVNVTVNSLAHCKYEHEIMVCGSLGSVAWLSSSPSRVVLKTAAATATTAKSLTKPNAPVVDANNNTTATSNSSDARTVPPNEGQVVYSYSEEKDTQVKGGGRRSRRVEERVVLEAYEHIEDEHAELPYLFMRGLYAYLARVRRAFDKDNDEGGKNDARRTNANSPETDKRERTAPDNPEHDEQHDEHDYDTDGEDGGGGEKEALSNGARLGNMLSLQSFEHSHLVQSIVRNINLSSRTNRWTSMSSCS